ncbi:MAG: hypothetical protein MUC81_00090 [Bacteroidia bacterium]|jgi:uncharacterized membrane protein YhaH (DUF805 family)|nr:hypothetical protein [Bacteroidia bacterium]
MLDRIKSGWSIMRVLYLLMGITIIVQSVLAHQFAVSLFGIYFAAMSVLGIGCASGACYSNINNKDGRVDKDTEVSFEEVK